ncbi:glutamine--fructose-6-phosphate transaminase (isomerizing) [Mycolicibacterium litorale]|uniref:glutamine--fructose-6-phosphate transaminase (isomerizing) n=1 Tax=Mycolicibacterium litorale TaxID=758802 RepID=UPI003CEB1DCA
MCGIIACRTHAPALGYLIPALRRLEYRGYDSVGVAVRTAGGGVARIRTVGRIGSLQHLVDTWTGAAMDGVGIGHTRWATHGAVTEDNAHPHTDCTGRIFVVHNGIIENAETHRTALGDAGHHFASSVDSEVLCHLIEDQLAIFGDLLSAVRAALSPLEGSWAIAVMDEATGRIVVAAQKSPLLVAYVDQGSFATSDIAAVTDWVDEFRVLGDGDVVELTDAVTNHNSQINTGKPLTMRCSWRTGDTDLNGYVDHMAKEIDEQPVVAARLLDRLSGSIANGALWSDLGLPPFDRVQVIGCGTSLNAGHVIANLVRQLGGLPVTLTVASEAADEIAEPNCLCIPMSQSGETADVLRAVESRRATGPTVALTNTAHSTLTRRTDAFITCDAGPEIGVAATKTFVCQVITGAALMISALVAMNRLSTACAVGLVDDLRRLPDQLATAGTAAKCLVPPITDELSSAGGFLFIARRSGVPYAAEGALKLKELTYRWAEHFPAGELKHGPLALVGEGTPVFVIDSGEPKLAANVSEVAARGGRVISIGPPGSTIPVRDGNAVGPWGPLESVIPMQVLARTLALAAGNDVDKPRNLAKSVTVE